MEETIALTEELAETLGEDLAASVVLEWKGILAGKEYSGTDPKKSSGSFRNGLG